MLKMMIDLGPKRKQKTQKIWGLNRRQKGLADEGLKRTEALVPPVIRSGPTVTKCVSVSDLVFYRNKGLNK